MSDAQFNVMADVFVEWTVETRLHESDIQSLMHDSNGCREFHKVQFRESLLDDAGKHLFCHFRAPDAESVRMALRCVGADIDVLWSGIIHDRPEPAIPNVVVECKLSHSILTDTDESLDAIASNWADLYGFKLTRAIVSRDGMRIICLCKAPDAESISLAQNHNDVRATSIWPCRRFTEKALVMA